MVQFQLSALKKQIKTKVLNKILKFRYLFKSFVFKTHIFNFGNRIYIVFDEGFYALKARKIDGLKFSNHAGFIWFLKSELNLLGRYIEWKNAADLFSR